MKNVFPETFNVGDLVRALSTSGTVENRPRIALVDKPLCGSSATRDFLDSHNTSGYMFIDEVGLVVGMTEDERSVRVLGPSGLGWASRAVLVRLS
jgi:hypothetical protein